MATMPGPVQYTFVSPPAIIPAPPLMTLISHLTVSVIARMSLPLQQMESCGVKLSTTTFLASSATNILPTPRHSAIVTPSPVIAFFTIFITPCFIVEALENLISPRYATMVPNLILAIDARVCGLRLISNILSLSNSNTPDCLSTCAVTLINCCIPYRASPCIPCPAPLASVVGTAATVPAPKGEVKSDAEGAGGAPPAGAGGP
mmetsp:Transcript_49934/g.122616  ORF Transcript_49934/g.122616 Transcript_49934/m.122616 type:complete len:204 (+) Transcript_49934:929-1540(+)